MNPKDQAPDAEQAEPKAPEQAPEQDAPEAENPSEDPATAVAPVDEDDIPEAGR